MDIFNLLNSIINFLQRQWKFILMFFVFGLILALVYDFIKKPYYESTAIATSGLFILKELLIRLS